VSEIALNIHHLEPTSRVNGPGCRFVIWTQGCTLACPSCFNPDTHSLTAGTSISLDAITAQVCEQSEIEGITFSGGEPLLQLPALQQFARNIRDNTQLTLLLFTGFTWEEIQRNPPAADIVKYMDIVIAGRYLHHQRFAKSLIGSTNKTIHFITDKYCLADLNGIPGCEIDISTDGTITISGIDPVNL